MWCVKGKSLQKIYEQVFAIKNDFVYTGIVPNKCLNGRQIHNFGTGTRRKFVIY